MSMNSVSSPQFRLFTAIVSILLLIFALYGCAKPPVRRWPPPKSYPAPRPVPTPRPAPIEPAPTYRPELGAGSSLYREAEGKLAQGQFRKAELSLERALRIEPRNAHYWHTMAKIKYGQKQFSQSVQFALKSKSLAGKNRALIRLNEQLMAKAKEQM